METVFFATGNAGKVKEMAPMFEERGYRLEQVEVDIREIDALKVKEVARRKVIDSYGEAEVDGLVIVEDTGLYVEALNGFPGAKAAFFAETVGASGLLKLLDGGTDRAAFFETAIAAYDGEEVKIFAGRLPGMISQEKRGEGHPHLPYDSFFIPDHGDGSSFAEKPELKEQKSHRELSTRKFLGWLEER